MNLTAFRKKLKIRVACSAVFVLLAVGVCFWGIYRLGKLGPDAEQLAWLWGFRCGLVGGIAAYSVAEAAKAIRALCSEQKMRALYIEENDERAALIEQRSGGTAMGIVTGGLALGVLAASFASQLVFTVLLFTLLFVLLVRLGCWMYCVLRYSDPGDGRAQVLSKALTAGGIFLFVLPQLIDRLITRLPAAVEVPFVFVGGAGMIAGLFLLARLKGKQE